MLEILALVFLTKKIGAICEAKGRKAGWYKALAVLLWFGCEAAGAIVGVIAVGGEGMIVYVYALIGAAVGAGISLLIAKSLEPIAPSLPSAEQQEQTPQQLSTKLPWNPSVFYALTILCGFGAAGILAGINYGRLGKPKLKWPTISISVVLFIALFVFTMITGWENVGLAYLINLPFAILLERVQRPLYKRYKEVTTSVKGGGWGIPVATGVASIALVFASAAIGVAFIIPLGVDIGDVTSIEIGRAMTGTIDSRTDVDAYSFKAVEGKCYVIETSKQLTAEPLENPLLTLWDSDGIYVLTWNDDYGSSRQSRIEWVAEATGTFYITVDSADKFSTGDYILTVSCVSE